MYRRLESKLAKNPEKKADPLGICYCGCGEFKAVGSSQKPNFAGLANQLGVHYLANG